MKHLFLLFILFVTLSLSAQTEWQKLSATKASDFGLNYTLPKTIIYIDAEYTKTTLKAGIYYRYAEKLLGIANPILEDSVFFSLDKVDGESTAIADPNSASMVQFKSTIPYLVLNSDGILCAVNCSPDSLTKNAVKPLPQNYVVQEAITNSELSLTEETLASGSTAKMAELAAKQIFRLRESRLDLINGDNDHLPKDGEGLKVIFEQLDKQEKALTALFVGTQRVEKFFVRTKITPTEIDLNHKVLFRFSKHFGFVSADDLSGEPVYLDIKATDRKEFLAADPKSKPSDKKGLIYNIPGKGKVTISRNNNQLFEQEFTFTQFGIQANFPVDLFTRKKAPAKAILHPITGAIVSLMQ
ncbi:MAG: DUF4831 family protein [Bacteroidales bacterium]|nr:DUF4831 family protein [Bacteroidales bacterium]